MLLRTEWDWQTKIVAHNCILPFLFLFSKNHSDESSKLYPNVEVLSSRRRCCRILNIFSVASNTLLLKWQLKQQNNLMEKSPFSISKRATRNKILNDTIYASSFIVQDTLFKWIKRIISTLLSRLFSTTTATTEQKRTDQLLIWDLRWTWSFHIKMDLVTQLVNYRILI